MKSFNFLYTKIAPALRRWGFCILQRNSHNNLYDIGGKTRILLLITYTIETVTWITIKWIMQDHRSQFQSQYEWNIREHTIKTVEKVLQCGTWELWFMTLTCNSCHDDKKIAFTCKSRFCNSCSKPASDKRLKNLIARRPQWLHYNHFIFTVPQELCPFFKRHRQVLKSMPLVASNAVSYFFRQKI